MKVYIAGPIAGKENGNREMFAKAAELLQSRGHETINPHDIPANHDGPCIGGPASVEDHTHQYGCYLRDDLMVMMFCDGVAALPGWELSTGASTEVHVAQSLGIPVIWMDELSR